MNSTTDLMNLADVNTNFHPQIYENFLTAFDEYSNSFDHDALMSSLPNMAIMSHIGFDKLNLLGNNVHLVHPGPIFDYRIVICNIASILNAATVILLCKEKQNRTIIVEAAKTYYTQVPAQNNGLPKEYNIKKLIRNVVFIGYNVFFNMDHLVPDHIFWTINNWCMHIGIPTGYRAMTYNHNKRTHYRLNFPLGKTVVENKPWLVKYDKLMRVKLDAPYFKDILNLMIIKFRATKIQRQWKLLQTLRARATLSVFRKNISCEMLVLEMLKFNFNRPVAALTKTGLVSVL
jgi:hypothetical protein